MPDYCWQVLGTHFFVVICRFPVKLTADIHVSWLPFNPYPAKLIYLNFHPLEFVSATYIYQVGENYSYNLQPNFCKLNFDFIPKNSY